jgi:hypothetical protein
MIKFAYLFVMRGGFLDGGPGLRYALGQAIYEYMIGLKRRELELSRRRP